MQSGKKSQFKIKNSETSIMTLNFLTLNSEIAAKIIVATCFDRPVSLIEFSDRDGLNQFAKFIPKLPISCTFYDIDKNYLYCGDIAGNLYTFSIEQKQLLRDRFIYLNENFQIKEHQALIMIHKIKHRFYLVNLRNQFKIIRANDMKLEYIITFNLNLTTAIMFNQKQSQQLLLTATFDNNRPPFIFNCHSQIQFQKAMQRLQQAFQAQQQTSDQIIFMNYFEKKNKLVCADRKHFISVYTIETLDQLCFYPIICWKVNTNKEILYMNIKDQYAYYVQSEKFEIINLDQRKKLYSYEKGVDKKFRWGIFLQKNQKRVSFVVAKGFNALDPHISKIGTPNLHLIGGNIKQ